MGDVLERIYRRKAKLRDAHERIEPYEVLHERAIASVAHRRPFLGALRNSRGVAIVAEIKRASPSAGLIARDFDYLGIACMYERAGADAVSVLTEEEQFLGELRYVREVRERVHLPLLRKDFLATPYEIAESAAYGADCVLLIVAGLDDGALRACMDAAHTYSLDVLVEVHDRDELRRAADLGAAFIGVNNRNLHTMTTDLAVSEFLLPHVPPQAFAISESGMRDAADVARLVRAGARGALVGESLMRSPDPASQIAAMKQGCSLK